MSDNPFVAPKSKGDQVKHRHELLKWNGWGYNDSYFYMDRIIGQASFTGPRYKTHGTVMPGLKDMMVEIMDVHPDQKYPPKEEMAPEDIPEPIVNESFMADLRSTSISSSQDSQDRLYRAHGQSIREIFLLREGKYDRVPDLVVWPENHSQVQKIVMLATIHNVVIIPFGGGTCVSQALMCPENEKRMIVSLDTSEMNRILSVNTTNMTMTAEAGIIGQDLEKQLGDRGYCTGHEPDSMEFSTLGGWVATRASGMKKNTYGNIEDLLVHVKMVTPKGVIEKNCQVPRMSAGPDIHQFVLGSEGTLGVITEATLKIRPLPACKKYGSIAFPDFESGLHCLHELSMKRCFPASIRLMDNLQFRFGQAMKAQHTSLLAPIKDSLTKWYVTKVKGFDPMRMVVATLLFEGSKEEVASQEKIVYKMATKYGGMAGGPENGERGYQMTFVIAYIRDIAWDYSVLGESFETSVPWDRCLDLCQNVKERIYRECKDNGMKNVVTATCRITQLYNEGACVYFYFTFNYRGMAKPLEFCEYIETCARDEILANGGSISHHHGIGKVRTPWLRQTVGDLGLGSIHAIKRYIDPNNIFGSNNLLIGQTEAGKGLGDKAQSDKDQVKDDKVEPVAEDNSLRSKL